jgi:hypothetical protein
MAGERRLLPDGARGFFVLPEAARPGKRPNPSWPGGPVPSYSEHLFEDEFGPPEDWAWLGDADEAQRRGQRPGGPTGRG